ncbi:MAG TPA: DUF1854 domain-containing protein [Armatimonadota bacterium]
MNTDLPITQTGTDLIYLDPSTTRIEPAPAGAVRLHLHDRCYLRVTAVWAFPFTDRRHWIAFRDGEDQPIGMIRDSYDLDKESRATLNAALERRYFIPRIKRVREAREEFGLLTMNVETDRGNVAFTVNNPRENIHWIDAQRILFVDAEENRYEVLNHGELDARSQALLANVI